LLPAICGRVCPQEDQCEKLCVLGRKGEPVNIGNLERFAADWEMKNKSQDSGKKAAASKPASNGKKVAVIGGGNVAVDAARTALRLGAKVVYLIYRRSEKEMPAREEEIEHAKEEGISFSFLTNPVSYIGDSFGFVKAAQCVKMELGQPDASGRASPYALPGSEFILAVDEVVVAVGTTPNPIISRTTAGLKIKRHGEIEVDGSCRTSLPGVFAGGDIVTGAATVITAMGAGRAAAAAIDEYLRGKK